MRAVKRIKYKLLFGCFSYFMAVRAQSADENNEQCSAGKQLRTHERARVMRDSARKTINKSVACCWEIHIPIAVCEKLLELRDRRLEVHCQKTERQFNF